MTSDLYFRVLGELSVSHNGSELDLGGPQRRLVLAVLLADANRVVPVERLVEALWRETPPTSHRLGLQVLISDLRRRLAHGADRESAPIVTTPLGYVLRVEPHQFDLDEFRADVNGARDTMQAGNAAAAVRVFRRALARWHGPAFAGFSAPTVDQCAMVADEERLAATGDMIDAALANGESAGLVGELTQLVADHPLHEGFHRQLMTAYAQTGRTADAMDVYRTLRRRIVAELGVEPSASLQRLHHQVLSSDPAMDTPMPAEPTGALAHAPAAAYRQLPPDLADFTGRESEIRVLTALGSPSPGSQLGSDASERRASGTSTAIAVIEGMGGIGKTRLAVHAAHRVAAEGRFADGQLYVDLRGMSPGGSPADPADVLESFLRLLGVPASKIPAGTTDRSALFRDRVIGQDMLILLDNAADEHQILPLLPSGPSTTVIVTSRRTLALDGSIRLSLDVFTPDEAFALLASVIGSDRVTAEPAAASQLIALCGHLPLAIAIAAQRLRARPAWSIARLASRLIDDSSRLDELTIGQRAVESVLAHSYYALPPDQQRLFRLLGIHPGVDFTAISVAALTGLDVETAETVLESLLDQHLLDQSVADRYHIHDLVRAYAARRCRAMDRTSDRDRAISGVLDWYAHGVNTATAMIRRFHVPGAREIPEPKAPAPVLDTTADATGWLDAEYANIVAAIQTAAGGPWHDHAVQLPHALVPYFVSRGALTDAIVALGLATDAAQRLHDDAAHAHVLTDLGYVSGLAGITEPALRHLSEALTGHQRAHDTYAEALTRNYLGGIYRRLGRHADEVTQYATAYELFIRIGDQVRSASTLSSLSVALHLDGRHEEAIDHALRAIELARDISPVTEAAHRTNLGHMYARLDRHAEAVEQASAALAIQRAATTRVGETVTLGNLAFSYARLGRHAEAIDAGTRSLELARDLGFPGTTVASLNALGDAHRFAGDAAAALTCYREAHEIATSIGDADESRRAAEGVAVAARVLADHLPATVTP